jgi:uncharacterized membrane protein HdeD (DUF308 family)|tara:strand:+ start:6465 stop:6656 length:192 start_codon:yes stop_codon:yes gene_type:complete
MIKFVLNNNNFDWLQILKFGVISILIGLLILLFGQAVIVLLASIFIVIGVAIILLAFKLWSKK